MTTLITNADSTIGTSGAAGGIVVMGSDIGATQVTVIACESSLTGTNGAWIARLYQNNTPDFSGATELGSQAGAFTTACPTNETIVYSGITVTQPFLIAWFNMNQPGNSGTWHVTSVEDNFSGAYCASGVQLQSGADFVYYLTPGLIDVWLGEVGLAFLAPFFTAFWFTTLSAQELCTALPPPTPATITSDPSAMTQQGLEDLLRAIAWQNVCQCSSGGTKPPAPSYTAPTGTPSLPTISCSNSDVCATITDIWQDLAMTQKRVNEIYDLVLLIQRQSAPFGFITGACHSGLTGTGSIAVSDILGLSVSFTGGAATTGTEAGTPNTIYDAGWINVGDSAGYRERIRITANPFVYLPIAMGEATVIGYTLNPLITAEICELVKEP